MKILETTARIVGDGYLIVEDIPVDKDELPRGQYQVVLVINKTPIPETETPNGAESDGLSSQLRIEAQAAIGYQGFLAIYNPLVKYDLPPGQYQAVVVVDEASCEPLELKPIDLSGVWPPDCTFRREDIYGDDGR